MLVLRYEKETLVSDEEPDRFLKTIEGQILLTDAKDREHTIGTFLVHMVDLEGAVSEKVSPLDVFDATQTTMDYYVLYEESLEFKAKVLKAMKGDDRWDPNMLILDRMEIYPAYRGRTYGLHTLRWLQHHFAMGCGIVAMKPFPLQFEDGWKKTDAGVEPLDLHLFTRDERKALKALRQYYSRLGFALVPGTGYMVRDPMQPLPSLEQCGLTNDVFLEERE